MGEFGPEKVNRGYTLHRNSRMADAFGAEKRRRGSKEYPDGKKYMCVVDAKTFRELLSCGVIVVFEGADSIPEPYRTYNVKDNVCHVVFG